MKPRDRSRTTLAWLSFSLLTFWTPKDAALAQPRIAAETDNQYERVKPSEVRSHRAPAATPDEDGRYPVEVRGAFGQGIRFGRSHDDFAVQLRARMQLQGSLDVPEDDDVALGARIRRMRLVLGGHALHHLVTYYIQLGFARPDLEDGNRVPLRDAFLTFHLHRDANLRLGQMKVPFDRQRVTSSSRLQFVDRAGFVRVLNLDRDTGIQLYSTDLLGLRERLSYQLGVFNGEGRNRISSDLGLLYVGRLQWTPFGAFDDLSESDFKRGGPRLAIAGAAAFNHMAQRAGSTQGALFDEDITLTDAEDFLHATADLLLKFRGASILIESLLRQALNAQRDTESGWGVLAQGGYLLTPQCELAARVAHSRPGDSSTLAQDTSAGAVFSWYFLQHDLKLQTDYTASIDSDRQLAHLLRSQLQLFF
ncbi:MAG: porin [Polyangiales bacterium]